MKSEFLRLVAAIPDQPRLALAELNDFLSKLSAHEFRIAVAQPPASQLEKLWANYVAAMVEITAHTLHVQPPAWTKNIVALPVPHFASEMMSLRLHLLLASPPPFRRRGIFIDSTVGDRV